MSSQIGVAQRNLRVQHYAYTMHSIILGGDIKDTIPKFGNVNPYPNGYTNVSFNKQ